MGLAGGLNTYGYVGANPIDNVDPLGLDITVGNGQSILHLPDGARLPNGGEGVVSMDGPGSPLGVAETALNLAPEAKGLAIVGSLDDLARAAQVLDRAGFTKAGRALQKHGSRPGSQFPKAKGCPADINKQAQDIIEDLLTDPKSTTTQRHHARFGNIIEIKSPTGEGLRYDVN